MLARPPFIETTIQVASMRQINAAIGHLQRLDYECAITLAGAAEGMLPETANPHLRQKLKEFHASLPAEEKGPNAFINWLKHGTFTIEGPRIENAKIEELEAIFVIRKAADQGNSDAQFNLALLYDKGQGVPQNYATAMNWYRKAANQGNARAQNNLGEMHKKGKGVPQDYTTAMSWYRKAANQGNTDAQSSLGEMYEQGKGVAQDYKAAISWYEKAALRTARAQFNLGRLYANGRGVPQDYETAVFWYSTAADRGYSDAQRILGEMYAKGQGVQQNFVTAHQWLNLAAAKGADGAVELRDELAAKMTTAQISEAQRLARDWKPRKW